MKVRFHNKHKYIVGLYSLAGIYRQVGGKGVVVENMLLYVEHKQSLWQ